MADKRHALGLVDTSVVIDLELIDPSELPVELALSAVTMGGTRRGTARER